MIFNEKDFTIRIPSKEHLEQASPVRRDIWNAVLYDSWMWLVIWGKPRTGKTTIALQLAYEVYQDWDAVIQSCFFNLNGFLYKIKNGIPGKLTTLNGLHSRVPLLIADDFGAQCNKAKIQHEPAWDIVKGAWDTLATKVGVILGTMGSPAGATQQLQDKYTHEIYVYERGKGKYNSVDWNQDYYGWRSNQHKISVYDLTFNIDVPADVYKQYDELRMSLVDELVQQIEDSQIENEGGRIFSLLNNKDTDLIEMFYTRGQIPYDVFRDGAELASYQDALRKCKARGLVVPIKKSTAYWYDLTEFGVNVLQLIQNKGDKGQAVGTELKKPPKPLE